MKKDTVAKILKRYEKSLNTMRLEAIKNGDLEDASHYQLDKTAIHEAIRIVERSNT